MSRQRRVRLRRLTGLHYGHRPGGSSLLQCDLLRVSRPLLRPGTPHSRRESRLVGRQQTLSRHSRDHLAGRWPDHALSDLHSGRWNGCGPGWKISLLLRYIGVVFEELLGRLWIGLTGLIDDGHARLRLLRLWRLLLGLRLLLWWTLC